ncbi:MAG: ferritin [Candidatus Omnitrophica bacterium]|nr:ferritin [Candidatus Omnitrophota bacterium]
MISKKLLDALNYQINREIYSAYFYLGMAAYAASLGFKGFASWFTIQFKEELVHAEKIFNYIGQKNERAVLAAIETPPQDFKSPGDLFERTLEHEKKVTAMIRGLVGLAKSENDKETETFLQWFVKEQVEEEATPASILEKLKPAEQDKQNILKTDSELAKRTWKG